MSKFVDWLVARVGWNWAGWIIWGVVFGWGLWLGWCVNGWRLEGKLATLRADFDAARVEATAQALAHSEAQRARELTFTEKLSLATQEADHAKTQLAATRTRGADTERRLRDARAALAASLNKSDEPATAACGRAADAAISTLGACATRYRDMATEFGSCLAAAQLTEKLYNAARDLCR